MSDKYNFQTPDQVIVGFFNRLNEKKYEEAYDCLTPRFQEKIWEKEHGREYGLGRFTKGYLYTDSIQEIVQTEIVQNQTTAEYHVTYKDNIQELHYAPIDALMKLTTKEEDMQKFSETVESFKGLLIDTLKGDPKEVNDIMASHLFKPNCIETCLWLANADYSQNDLLFTKTPKTLLEYRRSLCVKSESGWLIDGLRYQ